MYSSGRANLGRHAVLEVDQLFDRETNTNEEFSFFVEHPEVVVDLRRRPESGLNSFPGRPFGELTALHEVPIQ